MDFLVAIAVLAGLVWGGLTLRRGGLLAGLAIVMLSGICFSLPMFKLEAGPLPLTADRLALVVVVAQYILFRRWGLADVKPLGRPEWLLLAFVAVVALRTFTADWTQSGYQPVAWLVIYYMMPLAVYWIARQTPLSERAITALLIGLTAFAVYLSITTIAEWRQWWPLVFPKYVVDSAAQDGEWIGRGRGPLLHPIGNGILLSVCLAAVMCWWPRVGRPGKMLVLAATALVLVALYATLTRSVWIGAVVTVGLIAALSIPQQWRLPVLGGGMIAALAFAAVSWESLLSYKRERHLSAEMAAESAQLRPVLAQIAWNMFLDRPLLGCGYAQYGQAHLNYTADRSSSLPLEKGRGYVPHNVVLSLLTETGLVGLGLFLAMLASWAFAAWRLWTTPDAPLGARQVAMLFLVALAAYLVNGMFHDLSVIAMGNMTLFFLAGLNASVRGCARGSVGAPAEFRPRLAWQPEASASA